MDRPSKIDKTPTTKKLKKALSETKTASRDPSKKVEKPEPVRSTMKHMAPPSMEEKKNKTILSCAKKIEKVPSPVHVKSTQKTVPLPPPPHESKKEKKKSATSVVEKSDKAPAPSDKNVQSESKAVTNKENAPPQEPVEPEFLPSDKEDDTLRCVKSIRKN